MKNIFLASLVLASACELKTTKEIASSMLINPCGLPENISFDNRLIEIHEFDKVNCRQEGSACYWQDINTHVQVLVAQGEYDQTALNGSGLKISYGDVVEGVPARPSNTDDLKLSYGDANLYLDGEGPYHFSDSYFLVFGSNEGLQEFKTRCLIGE